MFKFLIIALATSALAACSPPVDEALLTAGHPADPGSRAAAPLAVPGSLEPELRTVRPRVGSATPKPERPAKKDGAHDAHRHHR